MNTVPMKFITNEEIEANQDFLEQCAKDYRRLSTVLINKLADALKVTIDPRYPILVFNPFKRNGKQVGQIQEWKYFLHGHHCGFENTRTGQLIETPLVFGLEFGELDPYFFTKYIKSTPEYQPLPITIYKDYDDGVRIIEKMVSLGKFERIPSNITGISGVVVTDRDKIDVQIFRPD